jgi:hypothetical protein
LGFNANAQSDGFFSSNTLGSQYRDGESTGMPMFPNMGEHKDQNANAPLGSGLALLAGLGIAYAMKSRKDEE